MPFDRLDQAGLERPSQRQKSLTDGLVDAKHKQHDVTLQNVADFPLLKYDQR